MKIKNWLAALMISAMVGGSSITGWAQDEEKKSDEKASAQQQIQVDGGKLVIIDEKGNKQEIDIPNAKSVMITRSVESKVVDGKEEKTATGRAVVLGPDGNKIEIILDGDNGFDLNNLAIPRFDQEGFDFQIAGDVQQVGGKYFIGVHCEPVDEALRSHLKLETGAGLVVKEVTPESPAQEAGLHDHDIIVYAGDSPVGTTEALSKAVNQAGEDGVELSISVIREGGELQVTVKPAERKDVHELMRLDGNLPQQLMWRVQPGLMMDIEKIDPQQIQAQVEEAMKAVQDEMKNLPAQMGDLGQFRAEMEKARAEMAKAREEMEKAMQEMRRALSEELKQHQENKDKDNDNDLT
ncbi:MAG: PDZ domain-containing protein [Pirellulaceae bacterium]